MPDFDTKDRPDTLYLTDREIAGRLGISPERWKENAAILEAEGMPGHSRLFGGRHPRRYWPAVRRFLDEFEGLKQGTPHQDMRKREILS